MTEEKLFDEVKQLARKLNEVSREAEKQGMHLEISVDCPHFSLEHDRDHNLYTVYITKRHSFK